MNPHLAELQPYPFERLAKLLGGTKAADKKAILWSIGEPKHAAPAFIAEIIAKEIGGLSNYPLTIGDSELREAIGDWLKIRFKLKADSISKDKNILPCNGSREAIFALVQAVVTPGSEALVLMPNPFYQIYEGAALLAGARPYFLNVDSKTLQPDFDSVPEAVWRQCQLLIICTPGNPTGAVLPAAQIEKLIKLADQFDFVLASDECYSELYPDENQPPVGLLEVCSAIGRDDYKRCIVFHSLSKRSNLPGMRSGFIAGDAEIIAPFKLYRTYHGCAMSPPFQKASTAAWRDEVHVIENRTMYRQKFKAVLETIAPVMKVEEAQGAFYLWPETSIDETDFTRLLFAQQNLTVVPGTYLSRPAHGTNPGANRVRMALVAPLEECIEGAQRLRAFVESL
ncbi:succinyldiaminopimelate transaminase [soil metagenome]